MATELKLSASEEGKVITAKRDKDTVAVARRDVLSGNFEVFVGPEPEHTPEEAAELGVPLTPREYLGQAYVLNDNKTYRVQVHQQRPALQRFNDPKDAVAFLLDAVGDRLDPEPVLETLPGEPLPEGTPNPDPARPDTIPGVGTPVPETAATPAPATAEPDTTATDTGNGKKKK